MKKHIIIFAAAITPLAFFSCSKEKMETPQKDSSPNEIAFKPIFKPIISLDSGLAGRFEFDGNLLDKVGKLKATLFDINSKPFYTTDRKGVPDGAIEFDGTYGLVIDNVPNDTTASIAAWVKYEGYPTNGNVPMVEGSGGLQFSQFENTYQAATLNNVPGSGQYVISGPIDRAWHHLVATRNANMLYFYIDGALVGTSPTPAGGGPFAAFSQFVIGFGWNAGYQYWRGSMDNLCFYSRTLSWVDIQALYKQ